MNIEQKKSYYRTLTIAGSDSGGGAGIQADLKTFSALGCYGMSAITALTAQNTQSVEGVFEVTPDFVAHQIRVVAEDIGIDAVKIGMLNSAEIVETVAEELNKLNCRHVVLDPVMVAKSGDKLLQDSAVEALKRVLLPQASVITPNLPEAEVLLGENIQSNEEIKQAGRKLLERGARAVLIKGGHAKTQGEESSDLLTFKEGDSIEQQWITGRRINTQNTHGTGCTYSSAIAAYLAKGYNALQAVQKSKEYISRAIEKGAAYKIGKGHGPVHHFHTFWD